MIAMQEIKDHYLKTDDGSVLLKACEQPAADRCNYQPKI